MGTSSLTQKYERKVLREKKKKKKRGGGGGGGLNRGIVLGDEFTDRNMNGKFQKWKVSGKKSFEQRRTPWG